MPTIGNMPVRYKRVGASMVVGVNFSPHLRKGELLTGTPSLTVPVGITTASPQVNTAAETIDDKEAARGKAVLFMVSGGTAGTTYEIIAYCSTTEGGTVVQNLGIAVIANDADIPDED